jgi:2-keto-4-pentenoate hydratase/2-oxohepta-3-ene-1,7-dioic acid hydratase in catechol pathway
VRLVTFVEGDGQSRVGALAADDRRILDLLKAAERGGHDRGAFRSMLALIDGGERALDLARAIVEQTQKRGTDEVTVARDQVQLLAPVPVPRQMRDFLTFEQHLRDARKTRFRKMAARMADPESAFADYVRRGLVQPPDVWYERPIYYKCNRFSLIGAEADIHWPSYAKVLDYELEFGVFIGKSGVDISAGAAKPFIFGYTIFNDVSARDTQSREMEGQLGPAKGKDFDSGNVMGPCLVTADEIPDPYNLTMKARVNGEEWSRGNTSTMHWRFEQIIEYVSRDETIYPGEFFGSGTVGSGCGLELDRWLAPGDTIELEVERIGILRNRVVKGGSAAPPKKTAIAAIGD